MKKLKDPAWRLEVGSRLLQGINAAGKKPSEIARLFGISQARLSNYIRGVRPLDIELAMFLSKRFGIKLEWLYMGDIGSLRFDLAQKITPIEEGERGAPH